MDTEDLIEKKGKNHDFTIYHDNNVGYASLYD